MIVTGSLIVLTLAVTAALGFLIALHFRVWALAAVSVAVALMVGAVTFHFEGAVWFAIVTAFGYLLVLQLAYFAGLARGATL